MEPNLKQIFLRIVVIMTGTVVVMFVISGSFWMVYGGIWLDYLKLSFVPFAILVPSGLWNHSEPLVWLIALLCSFVLLIIVYVVSALVSRSRLRHKSLTYVGLTVSALAVYTGCYWLMVLAFRAITCFYLPPFRYF